MGRKNDFGSSGWHHTCAHIYIKTAFVQGQTFLNPPTNLNSPKCPLTIFSSFSSSSFTKPSARYTLLINSHHADSTIAQPPHSWRESNRTPGILSTTCHHYLDLLNPRIKSETGPCGLISKVTRKRSLPRGGRNMDEKEKTKVKEKKKNSSSLGKNGVSSILVSKNRVLASHPPSNEYKRTRGQADGHTHSSLLSHHHSREVPASLAPWSQRWVLRARGFLCVELTPWSPWIISSLLTLKSQCRTPQTIKR